MSSRTRSNGPARRTPTSSAYARTRRWRRPILLLLLASFFATSCARTRYITQMVPVPVAVRPALKTPPPADPLRLGVPVDLVTDGCPLPYAACITPVNAVMLAVQIAEARALFRTLQIWAATAWLRAGPGASPAAPGSDGAAKPPASSEGTAPVGEP